ncbi:unnamed protein product [Scytosiphon promiscuus]
MSVLKLLLSSVRTSNGSGSGDWMAASPARRRPGACREGRLRRVSYFAPGVSVIQVVLAPRAFFVSLVDIYLQLPSENRVFFLSHAMFKFKSLDEYVCQQRALSLVDLGWPQSLSIGSPRHSASRRSAETERIEQGAPRLSIRACR